MPMFNRGSPCHRIACDRPHSTTGIAVARVISRCHEPVPSEELAAETNESGIRWRPRWLLNRLEPTFSKPTESHHPGSV